MTMLTLLATLTVTSTPPPDSLVGLRLGLSRAEVEQVGPTWSDPGDGPGVRWLGRTRLVFTRERLSSVEVRLADRSTGLSVRGAALHQGASLEEIARAVPGCGDVLDSLGGPTVECDGLLFKSVDGAVSAQLHAGALPAQAWPFLFLVAAAQTGDEALLEAAFSDAVFARMKGGGARRAVATYASLLDGVDVRDLRFAFKGRDGAGQLCVTADAEPMCLDVAFEHGRWKLAER